MALDATSCIEMTSRYLYDLRRDAESVSYYLKFFKDNFNEEYQHLLGSLSLSQVELDAIHILAKTNHQEET
jgi:hypothetical protein